MARETNTPIKVWQKKERKLVSKQKKKVANHDCWQHVEYVETDGALGQAYYCGVCGTLLQVG